MHDHSQLGLVNCQGRTETCGGQAQLRAMFRSSWTMVSDNLAALVPKRPEGINLQDVVRIRWCLQNSSMPPAVYVLGNNGNNGKDIFNVHWPNSLGLIEGFCTVCEQPCVNLNLIL